MHYKDHRASDTRTEFLAKTIWLHILLLSALYRLFQAQYLLGSWAEYIMIASHHTLGKETLRLCTLICAVWLRSIHFDLWQCAGHFLVHRYIVNPSKGQSHNHLSQNNPLYVVASISRVSGQNGVSLLYIMLEIHHSGWEPSICFCILRSILCSSDFQKMIQGFWTIHKIIHNSELSLYFFVPLLVLFFCVFFFNSHQCFRPTTLVLVEVRITLSLLWLEGNCHSKQSTSLAVVSSTQHRSQHFCDWKETVTVN